jgi:hypothetical protein
MRLARNNDVVAGSGFMCWLDDTLIINELELVINNDDSATLDLEGIGVSHVCVSKLNCDRRSNRSSNHCGSLLKRHGNHVRAIDGDQKPTGFHPSFFGGRARVDSVSLHGLICFLREVYSNAHYLFTQGGQRKPQNGYYDNVSSSHIILKFYENTPMVQRKSSGAWPHCYMDSHPDPDTITGNLKGPVGKGSHTGSREHFAGLPDRDSHFHASVGKDRGPDNAKSTASQITLDNLSAGNHDNAKLFYFLAPGCRRLS